jgi:hypothetical protein
VLVDKYPAIIGHIQMMEQLVAHDCAVKSTVLYYYCTAEPPPVSVFAFLIAPFLHSAKISCLYLALEHIRILESELNAGYWVS